MLAQKMADKETRLPNAQGVDTASWRTVPNEAAAPGKGLQLLFRLATYSDVKPPKRGASRWYGEADSKGRRTSGGGSGGRMGGASLARWRID